MDEPKPLDVIAVGAHPDDVEIGCGGTLAVLVKQGLRVGIVDLTDGEPTPRCPDVETRLAEAQKSADTLGVHERIVLNLPNRRLFDNFESRIELAKQFRIFRPRVVMSIGAKTPMASPDHWQASQITDAAVFYSRLTKWEHEFEDLPVHTVERQIYYSFFFETEWYGAGANPFIFDISETLGTKLDSIRCYETQFPKEKEYIFEKVKAMAISRGSSAGFDAGEQFSSTRAIGSNDLMGTLFPS